MCLRKDYLITDIESKVTRESLHGVNFGLLLLNITTVSYPGVLPSDVY